MHFVATVLASLLIQGSGQQVGPRNLDLDKLLGELAVVDERRALRAVAKLAANGPSVVPRLLPYLGDPTQPVPVRVNLTKVLEHFGPRAASAVPTATKNLADKHLDLREESLILLARIGSAARPALPEIKKLFDDRFGTCRQLALYVAVLLSEDKVALLPEVERKLEDKNVRVRAYTARVIAEQYGPRALGLLDQLVALLDESDRDLNTATVEALSSLGWQAMPKFLELYKSGKSTRHRLAALTAIGQLRPIKDEQVAILVDAVRSKDTELRKLGGHALRRMGAPAARALSALLASKGPPKALKLFVLEEIRVMGQSAVGEWQQLAAMATGDDKDLRMAALRAFGGMRKLPAQARDSIAKGLADKDEEIVEEAIPGAARLGAAVEPLLGRLLELLTTSKRHKTVDRAATAFALLGSDASPVLDQLLEVLKSEKAVQRARASVAIARMPKVAQPRLRALFASDETPRVRRAVLATIGQMGSSGTSSLAFLREQLGHSNETVRRDAALALRDVGVGSAEVLDALVSMRRDSDREVRVAVFAALGKLGRERKDIVELLAVGVKDGDELVRWSAIEALGWEGNAAAVQVLIAALDHKDQFHRMKAAISLEAIGKDARAALPKLHELFKNDLKSIHAHRAYVRAINTIRARESSPPGK